MFVKMKNLIFSILYILVIIYLLIFVPSLWGQKPLVVISGSMEPTLQVGGLLYYHEEEPEQMRAAVERGASYKQPGFAEADFSSYAVELPLTCKGKDLVVSEDEDAAAAEEGEKKTGDFPAFKPDAAPAEPEQTEEPEAPASAAQPQPEPTTPPVQKEAELAPLSPAEALEAYKKILREM